MKSKESPLFPLAGPIIAVWALLAGLNYAFFPDHLRKIPLVIDALAQWMSIPPGIHGLLSAAPSHLLSLAAAGTGLVFAWLAGCGIAPWLRASAAPLRLGLGLGAGMLAMLGAGFLGLFRPSVFLGGAILFAVPAFASASFRPGRPLPNGRGAAEPVTPSWVASAALVLALLSAALNFLGALAPETGYDSLIQHLADPRMYLASGRIYLNEMSSLARHPAGLEMLYGWLIPLGGDSAAKIAHFMMGLLAAWSLAWWTAARLGRREGILLGSVFYLTPFIGILSARSYVDNGLSFFSALCLLAPFGSPLQGVMIGLAISTKYLGGYLLIAWAAAFLLRGEAKRAVAVAIGASAAAACWGAANWLFTGNPVYPFGWKLLDGLGWDSHSAAEYAAELKSYAKVSGFWQHAAVPWLLAIRDKGALDDGSLGAVFIMAAPLIAAFRGRGKGGVVVMAAAVSWLLWLFSPRQARYALAFLPLTFAAVVEGFASGTDRLRRRIGAFMHLIPAVLIVQFAVSAAAIYMWVNPYFVVAGIETKYAYLSRVMEPRDPVTGRSLYMEAASMIAGEGSGRGRAYMLGDAKSYYIKGDVRVNSLFNPPLLARLARESRSADDLARKFRQRGITRVIYNVGGSIHIEYVHRMFHSTPRELGLTEEFFGRWLRETGRITTSGGDPMYVFYEVSRGRHPLPPYMPGVDTYIAGVEELAIKGERAKARKAADRLLGDYPDSSYLKRRMRQILGP